MAYKALYRAYRPTNFNQLIGQEHIVKTLKNAIKEDRVAHAYLFCGPRGTGKTTIAKILAKAVNCEASINQPCEYCDNCLAFSEGNHPDIIEIDAASNNGVDEVRDLIDKVKYAPIKGKKKIYIIDEVHMMSSSAFNALLKTLEEPPEHIIFILATTEPQKVIPTIISRCQRFDFKKASVANNKKLLSQVLNIENVKYQEDAISLIAQLADGGMRDALSILEQCLSYIDHQLTLVDVNKVYGIVSISNKIEFLLKLLKKDMGSILNSINDFLERGIDIKRLTFDLVDILKDVIIYRNTNNEAAMFVLTPYYYQLIAPYITVEESFSFIDILMETSNHYREAIQSKIYFEIACMKICNKVNQEIKTDLIVDKKEIEVVEESIQEDYIAVADEFENENEFVESVDEMMKETTEFEEEPLINKSAPNIHYYRDKTTSNEDFESLEEQLGLTDLMTSYSTLESSISELLEKKEINKAKENSKQILLEENQIIEEEINQEIELDSDYLLNILVQADRKILNNIQGKWIIIKRYMANINTAKYASILSDGAPVAASEDAIIIAFEHKPSCNNVNNQKEYTKIKRFLKEILNSEFEFVAITTSEWTDVRNKYLKLRQVNKLPKAKPIKSRYNEQTEETSNHLSAGQRLAVELFGNDIVDIEE